MAPDTVNQSWTFYGFWIVLVGFLGAVARQVVPYKKQANDAEGKLRDALLERVGRLEQRLDKQQVRHDAEKRLLTHKLRNMTANFDSMLMMLEMNPERGPEIVAKIKDQRARQMLAEAQESAIIYAEELRGEDPENLR
jgi:hypothetical protein